VSTRQFLLPLESLPSSIRKILRREHVSEKSLDAGDCYDGREVE
jgi:hypothetical protein